MMKRRDKGIYQKCIMNWNRFRNIFRIRFRIFYNRSELSHRICSLSIIVLVLLLPWVWTKRAYFLHGSSSGIVMCIFPEEAQWLWKGVIIYDFIRRVHSTWLLFWLAVTFIHFIIVNNVSPIRAPERAHLDISSYCSFETFKTKLFNLLKILVKPRIYKLLCIRDVYNHFWHHKEIK